MIKFWRFRICGVWTDESFGASLIYFNQNIYQIGVAVDHKKMPFRFTPHLYRNGHIASYESVLVSWCGFVVGYAWKNG